MRKIIVPLVMVASALSAQVFEEYSSPLLAEVHETMSSELRNNFTPLGAQRDGNPDGQIPEWTGGIRQAPAGYQKTKHHPDPFQDDQVLFTITSSNASEYADKLSPGQLAMFEKYPNWRMKVYPTRRSASFPANVYDAVLDNSKSARLTADGNGVTGARVASPFPMPENGLQAVWNHLLRYRGHTIERKFRQAIVVQGAPIELQLFEEKVLIPYNDPKETSETIGNRLAYFLQQVKEPAYIAGEILLVHETLNQNAEPRSAWKYNPGTRRVRRAPNIAFDTEGTQSKGLRTTDQFDMFNGSPERYDWRLVGKKEMYVPYNSYKMASNELKYSDLLLPGHMNPDHMRYELHRVWQVEGTVKSGTSHIYAKRTLFLDEDSWQCLVADHYQRDRIWRLSEAHCINYYEVPLLWDTAIAHYDLINGHYLVIGLNNEERSIEDFDVEYTSKDFSVQALQRLGRR